MHRHLAWLSLIALVAVLGCGDGHDDGHETPTPVPTPTGPPARAGELDGSFGTDGIVITDFGGRHDVVNALTVQPDGKIVAVGRSDPAGPEFDFRAAIARYRADGTLDAGFGDGGRAALLAVAGSEATTVVLAPNDTIVVGGSVTSAGPQAWFLARYDDTGDLDASFGTGGIVQLTVAQGGRFGAAALQPDGKIVAVGAAFDVAPEFAVARLNADGSLDPSFGNGGIVVTRIGRQSFPNAVVLQPDGRIVVGGGADAPSGRFALARYLPDGRLDPAFGVGGMVLTDVTPGLVSTVFGLALEDDGTIVAHGASGVDVAQQIGGPYAVVRYRPDGAVTGTVATALSSGLQAIAAALQPNGTLLFGTQTIRAGDVFGRAAVGRVTATGALDPEFATEGVLALHLRPNDESAIQALALNPNGTLIAGGFSRLSDATYDFALVRLQLGSE